MVSESVSHNPTTPSAAKMIRLVRKKSSMPTVSLPTAEFLYNVSSVALITGALAVFAGTIGTVWMGSVKEGYGDERIAANEAQTASANAAAEQAREGAAKAGERAAKANEAAGTANERAASLEKEAAEARSEQERLRAKSLELELQVARIGPRILTDYQAKKIAEVARAEPFKPIITVSFADEPESVAYAEAIWKAFEQGSLYVKQGVRFMAGSPDGVTVADSTGVIQRALIAAKIDFENSPPNPLVTGPSIVIGRKQYSK